MAFLDATWLTRQRAVAYCAMLLAGYGLLIAYLAITAHGHLDYLGRPLGTDFANVWSSGNLLLEGRAAEAFDPSVQAPYQQQLLGMGSDIFYGWHYPPIFLLIAALLAKLPYEMALVLWVGATTLAYFAAMRLITDRLPLDRTVVTLATLAYPAVFANTLHGQNGCLSAALLGGGMALLPRRPVAAGVLIGLLAYKPQYALLVPFALMVAGHWRAFASATATVVATGLFSVLTLGIEPWLAFLKFGTFTRETVLEAGVAGWFKLQGVFPAVRMLGGNVATAYAFQAMAIAAIFAVVMWVWRSDASHEQKSAIVILGTMLATPYAFNYDTVLLGPAIAFRVVDGIKNGFAAKEKSLLTLLWLTPLCSRELTEFTSLPIAIFVNGLAFAFFVLKVRNATSPLRSLAHV